MAIAAAEAVRPGGGSVSSWGAAEDADALAAAIAFAEAEDAAAAEEAEAALVEGAEEAARDAGRLPGGELSDEELAARGLAAGEDMPRDGRLRWWEFVAWEDSIAEDWAARLDARPDVRALAIWHNRDIRDAATGELKKQHLHMMAGDAHGRKWSRRQALRFGQSVLGLRPGKDDRLVRPIKRPAGYALYLTHANCPLKAQYGREEVLCFGGVDLDTVIGVVDNHRTILRDMYAWVDAFYAREGVLPAYAALVRYAEARRPGWSRVLASGRVRASMKTYLTSMEYDLGLDGRGAGTIAIVAAMIAEEEEAEAQGRPAKLTGGKHSVPSQAACAGGDKEEQHEGE